MNAITGTRVWVNRHAVDLRLAEGESILSSPDLAHRAGQLESRRWRRLLAAGIRRLIEAAHHRWTLPALLVVPDGAIEEAVRDARAALLVT